MFHNLLGCMELLPGLHAVFAIPNMNALPVHCANQVGTPADFLIGRFLVIVFCDPFGAPLEVLWTFSVPF